MIKTYISTGLGVLLAVQMAHAQESMDDIFAQLDAANVADSQPVAASSASDVAPAKAEGTGQESEMLSRLFEQGLAQYKAGQYDEAIMVFDAMLAVDTYNRRAVDYRKRASNAVASKEARKQGASI